MTAVGQTVNAPADAISIDAAGKWVTPGIIDTHSHLGVYPSPGVAAHQDGNEMSSPNTAEVSAEHSIWPQDPQFDLALAGGVTAMQLLPGSANLFGGRGVTVKNVPTRTRGRDEVPGRAVWVEDGLWREPEARLRPAQHGAKHADGQRRGVQARVAIGEGISGSLAPLAGRGNGRGETAGPEPAARNAGRRARRRDSRPQSLLSRRRDGHR